MKLLPFSALLFVIAFDFAFRTMENIVHESDMYTEYLRTHCVIGKKSRKDVEQSR